MPAERVAPRPTRLCALGVALLLASPARAQPEAPAPVAPPVADASPARAETPVKPFAAGTHFSMSWVRLAGAESCVTARELSRAVEARLHRPALGAPAETDVSIEGYVVPAPDAGFHAVVTITDARGTLAGKREIDGKGADCREMDASLALAIALMIDPDAAFAANAEPARPPRVAPDSPPSLPPKRPPPKVVPDLRATMAAGAVLGFGVLPGTAKGAWVGAALEPRGLFPIELDGHFWLGEKVSPPEGGVSVVFSRMTFSLLGCPLDGRVGTFRFGACAGVDVGTLTAIGNANEGLFDERRWIVDANLRGHADWFFVPHVALRLSSALAVPFIRDSFDYQAPPDPSSVRVYQLPPVGGDVGLGVAIQVP